MAGAAATTVDFDTLSTFEDERQLQAAIERDPRVLARPGEGRWTLVKQELLVHMPAMGTAPCPMDHFFVRPDGYPIIVEAKLAKNSEAEGEIVAQVLRYRLAVLSRKTFTVSRLRSLAPHITDPALWTALDWNLGQGKIRVVFALDRAPMNLLLAAAGLRQAGMDVDVAEVRCEDDVFQTVHGRLLSLDPIRRHGDWLPLATQNIDCDTAPFQPKDVEGVVHLRARLLPFPSSRVFRVLDADPVHRYKPTRHQIDEARPEGMIGIMPNVEWAAAGRNPYPPPPYNDPAIKCESRWRKFVAIAYHAWDIFRENGQFHIGMHSGGDVPRLAERLRDRGEPVAGNAKAMSELSYIVREVLRDWHLYGLTDVIVNASQGENVRDYVAMPPGT